VAQGASALGAAQGRGDRAEIPVARVDCIDPLEWQTESAQLSAHKFQPIRPALKIDQ